MILNNKNTNYNSDCDITYVNPKLSKLYDEIRSTCNEEWEKTSKIFTNASYVMKMFIQRIFVQSVSIKKFINIYLSKCN